MNKAVSLIFLFILLFVFSEGFAQKKEKKYSFYGGFGLGISTGYTYFSIQPGVIYHWDDKISSGVGVQYSYMKSNKSYDNVGYSYNIYGFNALTMFYPIKNLEFSAEFEDLYIKQTYSEIKHSYWSPALFGGMAYRYGNIIIGLKFNFLYDRKTSIYQDAFVPFVRIYF
jgi:hypothetical protein